MAVDSFQLLDNYMTFVIPDVTSRILGQQYVKFDINTVMDYWSQPGAKQHWGDYAVTTVVDRSGAIVMPWRAILVGNIQIGPGFPTSIYFWGLQTGKGTVLSKYRFWELSVAGAIRTNIQNRLAKTSSFSIPVPTSLITGEQIVTPEPFSGFLSPKKGLMAPLMQSQSQFR